VISCTIMNANSWKFRPKPSIVLRVAVGFAAQFLLVTCLGTFSIARAEEPQIPDASTDWEAPIFSLDGPFGPIEYRAGRGLHLGHTGLNIGGFSTAEVEREEGDPGRFSLDSVNFLILFEPVSFLRGFAEFEVGDLALWNTDSDDVRSNPKFDIERLYGDLVYNDALNLRTGKFQTPIGRWNMVRAEPLTWTATEPVVVEVAFDEHQTGGALFGSVYPGSNTLNYWLYGQYLDPLDPDSDSNPDDRSVGGRVEYGDSFGDLSIGTSFLASEQHDQWNYLGGIDAQWRIGQLELTSEFTISGGHIEDRDLWDVYLQGVYEVIPNFYFVGRYEHFDRPGSGEDADLGDVGVTWVPVQWLRFKANYRFSTHETEDVRRGLKATFSVLF
jgi:hypothetical protein